MHARVPIDLGAAAGTAIRDVCRREQWTRAERDCAIRFESREIADLTRLWSTCRDRR